MFTGTQFFNFAIDPADWKISTKCDVSKSIWSSSSSYVSILYVKHDIAGE